MTTSTPPSIIVGMPKMMSDRFEEENRVIKARTDLDWLTEKAHQFGGE